MPLPPFCCPESYFALARRRLPSPRPPALTANGFTCHVALVTGSVMDGGSGWGPAQLKVRCGDRGALPPPPLSPVRRRALLASAFITAGFFLLRPPLSRRRCLSLRRVSVYRRPRLTVFCFHRSKKSISIFFFFFFNNTACFCRPDS